MRPKCVISVFILVVIVGGIVFAESSAGKLVFTIREPLLNEDGFRITTRTLERGRDVTNWWEFHQYNICTMNPDGTDFRRLTNDAVSRNPRWSPDRERIAYISGLDGAKSLYVMWADGTENKQLIKKQYDIHDFWWSPLSHALLVVVEIDRPKDRLENWEVTVDGKIKRWRTQQWAMGWLHWDTKGEGIKEPNRRLLEVLPNRTSWPEWSSDRKWIAFKTEGLLALAEPDVVSMSRKWFLQRDEPPCGNIEEWSPDGKQLLFYTSGEICVATVEQGRFKNYLNLSLYPGRDATWSPDGSQVAFIGKDLDGRRTSEIFILDVETGKMRQITSTTYDYFDLHWR
jgi:Tol biopolymer transport system component